MAEPSEHTFEELTQHVVKAIAEVKEIPEDTIKLDSTFEELGVDSLDAMEMLFLMEEQFDVNMPDTAVRAMRNVRQVVEALDKLLRGEELEIPELPATPGEEPQAEAG
jgi:acyl carrier protein